MFSLPTDQSEAERVLSAIGRWGSSPDSAMVEWLATELDRLDRLNRTEPDEVKLRQRQGACQVLEFLLKKAESATGEAEKIRNLLQKKGARV